MGAEVTGLADGNPSKPPIADIRETGAAWITEAELAALFADRDTLRDRLVRIEAIATRGVGPDTTPEVALATIAHFVSLTLARVPA